MLGVEEGSSKNAFFSASTSKSTIEKFELFIFLWADKLDSWGFIFVFCSNYGFRSQV